MLHRCVQRACCDATLPPLFPLVAELHRALGRSSPVVSRLAGEVLAAVEAARRPEAVAAVCELRQQPWKELLAEQQGATAAAGATAGRGAAGAEQPAVADPVALGSAAAPLAVAKPTLQPRAVKPLLGGQPGASSLLGASAAAKPALQPRAVKPLGGRPSASSAFAAAPSSSAAATAAAEPAALSPPSSAAAGGAAADVAPQAAGQEQDAVQAAVPVAVVQGTCVSEGTPAAETEAGPAAKPLLKARQPKPLRQQPSASGMLASVDAVAEAAASEAPRQQPPWLDQGPPSAAGALLGAARGAGTAAAAAAAAAVKASLALPFSFAVAPQAFGGQGHAAPAAQVDTDADPAEDAGGQPAAGPAAGSQRAAIRAAVDAMRQANGSQTAGVAADGQEQQDGGQPSAASGAASAGAPRRAAGADDFGEFLPLPVSEKYGNAGSKRRSEPAPQPSSGGKKARGTQPSQQDRGLKRTMVELGLEGGPPT